MDAEEDSIANFEGIPDPDPYFESQEDVQSGENEAEVPVIRTSLKERGGSPPSPRLREFDADDHDSAYADFHTIDWVHEKNKDKKRHKFIHEQGSISWKGKCEKWFDAASGWLIVLLVGIAAGLVAGFIDVSVEWMTDFKVGVCAEPNSSIFYDETTCCWLSEDTRVELDNCTWWKTWAELAHLSWPSDRVSDYYVFNAFDYFMYVLISVFFATLAGLFVVLFAPYAAGSGIPEVKTILSGFVIRGYLGLRTLVVKAVGMVLAVSAGLSLGKEGPLVHVACCCGNLLVRIFPKYRKNEAKKREVLSAAAAAGVSVAFGAPVGGVLFSLEEASYYFPHKTLWRSFFGALVAVFTLGFLNPYFTGSIARFYVNHSHSWHTFELVPFAIVGVIGGIYGGLFIRGNILWSRFRRYMFSKHPIPIFEVAAVALVTGIVNYPNPFTRIGASELILKLFSQCSGEDNSPLCQYNRTNIDPLELYHDTQALSPVWNALWQLALAGIAKGLLTVFTYGIKVPAGLFIPSMFVGACFGRIVGVLTEQFAYTYRNEDFMKLFCSPKSTCVTPGLYAMVGAAATLGGVTKMTVSLVVIMFELTGGLTYIIPIMVAVMISKWVADAIVKDGIYDAHISLNGFPFMDSKEEYTLESRASDIMKPQKGDPPLTCIYVDNCRVTDLENLRDETSYFAYPCLMSQESNTLAGIMTRQELISALKKIHANEEVNSESAVFFVDRVRKFSASRDSGTSDTSVNLRGFIDKCPTVISDETPIETVIELLRKMGLRQILVTKNGKLLGIITKKDVLRHIALMHKKNPENIKFH